MKRVLLIAVLVVLLPAVFVVCKHFHTLQNTDVEWFPLGKCAIKFHVPVNAGDVGELEGLPFVQVSKDLNPPPDSFMDVPAYRFDLSEAQLR